MNDGNTVKKIDIVCSGGNTGADIAGLVAAEQCGLKTGGWAPKRYMTESGPQPYILRDRFGLKEHGSSNYADRTEKNITDCCATIILATDLESPGTAKTISLCNKHLKDYFVVNPFNERAINDITNFLILAQPVSLNIAGNRESKSPGISKQILAILTSIFTTLNKRANNMQRQLT